jgi:protein N-terminal methyltransferase
MKRVDNALTPQPSSPKRQKPNVGSALRKPPGPDFDKGIQYWADVDASVDGVLGGFGTGVSGLHALSECTFKQTQPVPHIEQLSSRLLLLSLIPSLHTFPSPLTPLPPPRPSQRLTVLDVGAGIGRVSRETLLPLFEDVILLEPVDKFVREAYRSALDGEWKDLPKRAGMQVDGATAAAGSSSSKCRGKRVWFVKAGLQGCDPKHPAQVGESLGVVGEKNGGEEEEGFGGGAEGEITYDV